MTPRTRLPLLASLMVAAACTTTTQEVNPKDSDTASESDGIDTSAGIDTDPYRTDTGRPGVTFSSGRFKITSIALAPAACEPCKADVDGDGTKENKISELLDAADLVFPGGFAVADVNPRLEAIIAQEIAIVLMSADNDEDDVLQIGIANAVKDTDGAYVPADGEIDTTTGLPKQRMTGTFISSVPSTGQLRFQTFDEGSVSLPFQFDDDEPVLNLTIKRSKVFGDYFPERGANPEKLDGFLIGAFSTTDVLAGTINPLIDAYDLWDDDEKDSYKDLAKGLIDAAADIDVDTTDPKISAVLSFTAEVEVW